MSDLTEEQKKELTTKIISHFRELYGFETQSEAELLEMDPNEFDMDPATFYEDLFMIFLGGDFPDDGYPEGRLRDTIKWFEERWDGETMDEPFLDYGDDQDFDPNESEDENQ